MKLEIREGHLLSSDSEVGDGEEAACCWLSLASLGTQPILRRGHEEDVQVLATEHHRSHLVCWYRYLIQ